MKHNQGCDGWREVVERRWAPLLAMTVIAGIAVAPMPSSGGGSPTPSSAAIAAATTASIAADIAVSTAVSTGDSSDSAGLAAARRQGCSDPILLLGTVRCTHGSGVSEAPAGPSSASLGSRITAASVSSFTRADMPAAVAPVCIGTGSDGNRVQPVYVVATGTNNAYSALAGSFGGWAGQADAVFANSSVNTRRIRYATNNGDPGCRISVQLAVLPKGSTSSFGAVTRALLAAGYNRKNRKYLIWADSSTECGRADFWPDSRLGADNPNNHGPNFAVVFRPCWAWGEGHEITHTLGAVLPGAPHQTAAGHCTDDYDIMCYADGSITPAQLRVVCTSKALEFHLDCGGDDYFSLKPRLGSWLARSWNVANSSFLTPPRPASPAAPASPSALSMRLLSTSAGISSQRSRVEARHLQISWRAPVATIDGVTGYWLRDALSGRILAVASAGARSLTIAMAPRIWRLSFSAVNRVGESKAVRLPAFRVVGLPSRAVVTRRASAGQSPTLSAPAVTATWLPVQRHVQLSWALPVGAVGAYVTRDSALLSPATRFWEDLAPGAHGKVVTYRVWVVSVAGVSSGARVITVMVR